MALQRVLIIKYFYAKSCCERQRRCKFFMEKFLNEICKRKFYGKYGSQNQQQFSNSFAFPRKN